MRGTNRRPTTRGVRLQKPGEKRETGNTAEVFDFVDRLEAIGIEQSSSAPKKKKGPPVMGLATPKIRSVSGIVGLKRTPTPAPTALQLIADDRRSPAPRPAVPRPSVCARSDRRCSHPSSSPIALVGRETPVARTGLPLAERAAPVTTQHPSINRTKPRSHPSSLPLAYTAIGRFNRRRLRGDYARIHGAQGAPGMVPR